MIAKALLLVTAALSAALAQNLLVNGDFEQPLDSGWTADTGGPGYKTIARDAGYQPDPDYEVMDSLVYQGWSRLQQIIDAPGAELTLSFSASFAIGNGSASCWPAACFVVGYYDGDDTLSARRDTTCTTPTAPGLRQEP